MVRLSEGDILFTERKSFTFSFFLDALRKKLSDKQKEPSSPLIPFIHVKILVKPVEEIKLKAENTFKWIYKYDSA